MAGAGNQTTALLTDRASGIELWSKTKGGRLPARRPASKKFTTIFGWSALWIMIWDTSIWRLACWNRWKIPSAQKCYPCSRYILLPMSPGRALKELVGPSAIVVGVVG